MASRFYKIKTEIRILGLDDAPFQRTDPETMIVGTVFRGGSWIDGILSTHVSVDGIDATEKISEMVRASRFKDLRVIMLDGLGFAGFNHVDIIKLNKETDLPVIVVTRDKPDFNQIKKALLNIDEFDFRWSCVQKAGEPIPVETKKDKNIFIQYAGISKEDAMKITRISSTRSLIPEPIRVAHLIAQGVKLGESKGKA